MAGKPTADPVPSRLPELRAELQLLDGARSTAGEPAWLIHDPLQNRFVQIDVAAHETLRYWRLCKTDKELVARVNAAGCVSIDRSNVEELIGFLEHHRFTAQPSRGGWRSYAAALEAGRHSASMTLLHNYLFFRIPLCRPQATLERTLPLARALAGPTVGRIVAALGLVGLYLVSRQFEAYAATLQGFFTWEGLLLSFLTLAVVKAAHELGHAYTAVAFGCRVHTMGVAFMMLAPLLYTDVTDSWRLTDRRKRLAIDSAGIRVELAIAAVALFAWAFLPEGSLRSIAFVLSAVSVASSLAINLNPFMRFDGYYLLSEALGVENLHPRSFALGRWKLREILFGLGAPPPETFPRGLTRFLVLYAWATWLYRLVLFVGIALVVYHYFFKALGILLFAVEIGYFVVRPLFQEAMVWWRHRRTIWRSWRTALTTGLVAAAILLALVPWSTRVEIPAVAEASQLQRLYAPRPARIATVDAGQGAEVKAGDPVVTLESPDIDHELELLRVQLAAARIQYGRRAADGEDRANSLLIESNMAGLQGRIAGLEREREELVVRAPFDGRIVELDTTIHSGRWISPRDQLALIVGSGDIVAKGYVAESDLWRIEPGSPALFIPEHAQRPSVGYEITRIAASSAAEIEIADLASVHQGRVSVASDPKRRLVPTGAQYLVHLTATQPVVSAELRHRGLIIAAGRPESTMARVWRQALKVLVRESGA